ncbi:MAG: toll/interleukin-1 receptor domain-containing protein [Oscillospiraceae bacterium]|nr:toll/interleukin-1 receptor domain-containing protein [Oscillospiraceae bacterium]
MEKGNTEVNNQISAVKPQKTERYVFISYSTKDSDIAVKTKEILENSGIRCWIAPWSITAGRDHASEIPKALNNCSAMVFLFAKEENSIRRAVMQLPVFPSCPPLCVKDA